MATLSDPAKALAREALDAAPCGSKTATAQAVAKQLGVSTSALYRALGVGGPSRSRAPARPEYREWVRIAVALANRAPKKPAPLDIAIQAAIDGGDLPPEAEKMPLGTAYRVAREQGLVPTARRTPRIVSDYPMQVVLIDASTSAHLVVDRRADPDDDDPPLRFHRAPTPTEYKNKPLGSGRRRLLVYCVWDMCTGYYRSRYVAAHGECAVDAMSFLCHALAEHSDRRVVMHGVPMDLWSDQGPLAHSAAACELLKRLEINLKLGKPYVKERMGGVERVHQTRWTRFEPGLFLCRQSPTLRVSDLNARLVEFEIKENGWRVSRTPVDGRTLSRAVAWVALVQRRPADKPLRRLPANPMETMAIEARRQVDQGGLVRWDRQIYEAPWHSRKVIARRAVDGSGDITLEDETGERCVAKIYQPRLYGEIRTGGATPLERLAADPASNELVGADVWAPAGTPPTVIPMPAPAAAAAPLENPLPSGIARCRDLAEAWRVFSSVYSWPVPSPLRARIEQRFEAVGLDRAAIVELAQEFVAAAKEQTATGGTR